MASPPAELTTLLSRLAASDVEFVLVGGLAAVAQGAPLTNPGRGHRATGARPTTSEKLLGFLATVNSAHTGGIQGRPSPFVDRLLGGT